MSRMSRPYGPNRVPRPGTGAQVAIATGAAAITPVVHRPLRTELEDSSVADLYELKGWHPTGIPTRERLRALSIEWTAEAAGAGT